MFPTTLGELLLVLLIFCIPYCLFLCICAARDAMPSSVPARTRR